MVSSSMLAKNPKLNSLEIHILELLAEDEETWTLCEALATEHMGEERPDEEEDPQGYDSHWDLTIITFTQALAFVITQQHNFILNYRKEHILEVKKSS